MTFSWGWGDRGWKHWLEKILGFCKGKLGNVMGGSFVWFGVWRCKITPCGCGKNLMGWYWNYILLVRLYINPFSWAVKCFFWMIYSSIESISQPANIGPQDVPRTSPSNVPRTSPKDPIWPSQGRPDLTSQGRPEMTSRGSLNLTFKGRPGEVDSGCPHDVHRTSPRGPWEYSNLDSKTFLSDLIRLTKSKSISTLNVYREPSKTSKMEHFLQN